VALIGVIAPAPAHADDAQPSWDDLQNAKKNAAQAKAQVDIVLAHLRALQNEYSYTRLQTEQTAETYFQAQIRLKQATATAAAADSAARVSAQTATASRLRAGLIIAHLARTTSGGVAAHLLANPRLSTDLLSQLGTEARLSETEHRILIDAQQNEDLASSLAEQAKAAHRARAKLASEAEDALAKAQAAQGEAQASLQIQQARSLQLTAQLADLTHTSQNVAAAYAAEQISPTPTAPPTPTAGKSPGGGGAPGSDGGAPNGSVVERALGYARAQLGKPYEFGGEGPDSFDCSGLTMMSYASAGVYIGGHSVNDQWFTAANRGQIRSYSDRRAGDLIFWGDQPGAFYHVGIYLGGGMMIAAPTEGEVVKIQPVWGEPYGQVARPSA